MPAVLTSAKVPTTQASATQQLVIKYFNTAAAYTRDRLDGLMAFVSNPNNANAIQAAVNLYGTTYTKTSNAGTTDMGNREFYYYAYYYNLYPVPSANQVNCSQISSIINEAIPSELSASDKQYVVDNNADNHNARTAALNKLASQYNSLYMIMNCDNYLTQQAEAQTAAQQAAALASSQASEISTYQQTAGASGGGISAAIWIAGGVAAIIAVLLVIKVVKKNK